MGMLTRRTLESQRARLRQSMSEPVASVPVDNLATLKAEAAARGIEYHPNIGYDKLLERVNAHKFAAGGGGHDGSF